MKDVSEEMQALPRVCPERGYTNMYGNLKSALTSEDFTNIFTFDGSVIVLATPAQLATAHKKGQLTEPLLQLCLKMHKDKAEADAEAKRLNPHLYPNN